MSMNNDAVQVLENALRELKRLKFKSDQRKEERLGLVEERLERIEKSIKAIEESIVG